MATPVIPSDDQNNIKFLANTQKLEFPKIIEDLINPSILKKDTHWMWYVFPTSKEGNNDKKYTHKHIIFKDSQKDNQQRIRIINFYLLYKKEPNKFIERLLLNRK